MSRNDKWALGIASTMGVVGFVLAAVVAVEMVESALAAMRSFVHVFDGAVSF